MATGEIKWFDSTKGYGFIKQDSAPGDIFVHISAVKDAGLPDLKEGQRVSYEAATNPKSKKLCAEKLALL